MSVQQPDQLRNVAQLPDQRPHLRQLVADASAWNRYARRMNARAIAAGLVTEQEVWIARMRAEEALTWLRDRIA